MEAYLEAEEAKTRLQVASEAAREMEATMAKEYFTSALMANDSVTLVTPSVVKLSIPTTRLPKVASVPATEAPIVSSSTTVSYMEQEVKKARQMEADIEEARLLANLSQSVIVSPKKGDPTFLDPEWSAVPLYPATTGDKLPTGWSVINTDTEGVTVTLKMGTAEGLMGFLVIMGMGKSSIF